jgi:hypothetical protein
LLCPTAAAAVFAEFRTCSFRARAFNASSILFFRVFDYYFVHAPVQTHMLWAQVGLRGLHEAQRRRQLGVRRLRRRARQSGGQLHERREKG